MRLRSVAPLAGYWGSKGGRWGIRIIQGLCKTHLNGAARRIATVFDKLNRLIKNYLPRKGRTLYKRLNPDATFAAVSIQLGAALHAGRPQAVRTILLCCASGLYAHLHGVHIHGDFYRATAPLRPCAGNGLQEYTPYGSKALGQGDLEEYLHLEFSANPSQQRCLRSEYHIA